MFERSWLALRESLEKEQKNVLESRTRHPKNMSITDLRSRKLTMRDAAMLAETCPMRLDKVRTTVACHFLSLSTSSFFFP